jgi:hypothetical protein
MIEQHIMTDTPHTNPASAGKINNPPSPPFSKPKVALWPGGRGGFETYFLGKQSYTILLALEIHDGNMPFLLCMSSIHHD